MAASRTVRVMGPAVSWLCAIGMMPARLTRPSVGLMPTIPFAEDGQTTDPSVSVPIATAQRLAATAAPEPELEPHGLRSSAYGFFVCPPRPLHPLLEWLSLRINFYYAVSRRPLAINFLNPRLIFLHERA